jgi:ribosomal protein S15P/S13E
MVNNDQIAPNFCNKLTHMTWHECCIDKFCISVNIQNFRIHIAGGRKDNKSKHELQGKTKNPLSYDKRKKIEA